MRNKKGFTLIEIVAIIILLSVIALITYPIVNNLINDSREDLYDEQIHELLRLSNAWVAGNASKLKNENGYSYALSFEELASQGYIVEENVRNPKTGERFPGCIMVTYNSISSSYDVNYDENCKVEIVEKEPSINLITDSSIVNNEGYATKDFDVKVVGNNITSYTYCTSTSECEPSTKVNSSGGIITINQEGITYVCVIGKNETKSTNKLCKKYNLDKTELVMGQLIVEGTLGLNGWYISDVNLSVKDVEGVTSTLNINKITNDTKGTDVILTSTTKNGKTGTKTYTIKVDKTKPTIGTIKFNGTLGDNDWYTSNVIISLINGSDSTSGHNSTTSNVSSITSNTEGTIVTVTTTDNAGNATSQGYGIKVDKIAPTLTAKGSNFEIKERTDKETSTYFNSPTYSISGGSMSCNPINIKSLEPGTYTLACTATGGNGLKTIANTELEIIEMTLVEKIKYDSPLIASNQTWTREWRSGDSSGLYSESRYTLDGNKTYYFRGQPDNNIKFAGLDWKIIRINEDGSVRIMLASNIGNNKFHSKYDSSYTYTYYTNSELKSKIDTWYNNNISPYSSKLASNTNKFCQTSRTAWKTDATTNGNASLTLKENYTPKYDCPTDANGYGKLSLNVGLITYDESIYAGGFYNSGVTYGYFMFNKADEKSLWSMSPAGVESGTNYGEVWGINYQGYTDGFYLASEIQTKPVINIKGELYVSGYGTSSDPYVVK